MCMDEEQAAGVEAKRPLLSGSFFFHSVGSWVKLRLSGLAVSTFNHGVISPDTVLSKPDFQVLPSPTC